VHLGVGEVTEAACVVQVASRRVIVKLAPVLVIV